MNEESLFQACVDQARIALEEKEVAIGCIFYHKLIREVIARGRNCVNATKNATRHAELNCIDQTIKYCEDHKLNLDEVWPVIDVYVTCEPCIMCARVLRKLNVNKIFYGCSNERFGGCRSVINVIESDNIPENKVQFVSGIREKETIEILKTFYAGENFNAPEEIRKIKKIKHD